MGFLSGIVKSAIPAIAGSVGGPIAGAVASGLVSGATGGGSTQTSYNPNEYQQIPGVSFQPFTYTSGLGSVTGAKEGDYGFNVSTELDPTLQNLSKLGLGSAETFYGMLPSLYARPEAVYDQTYDPAAAQQAYYEQGLAQLQPEFIKQQIQAQERMFGGGRLGLKLAGEAVGAGSGVGAVSPDAFGLGAAQSKALTDLYAQSRQAGINEELNRLKAETGIFTTQQQAEADYLNRILGGATGMFDLASGVYDLETAMRRQALNEEIARSNALKSGTQTLNPVVSETNQSILAGQLAPAVGQGVTGLFNSMFNSGSMGVPTSYSNSSTPWMSSSNQNWASSMGFGSFS